MISLDEQQRLTHVAQAELDLIDPDWEAGVLAYGDELDLIVSTAKGGVENPSLGEMFALDLLWTDDHAVRDMVLQAVDELQHNESTSPKPMNVDAIERHVARRERLIRRTVIIFLEREPRGYSREFFDSIEPRSFSMSSVQRVLAKMSAENLIHSELVPAEHLNGSMSRRYYWLTDAVHPATNST